MTTQLSELKVFWVSLDLDLVSSISKLILKFWNSVQRVDGPSIVL